MRSSMLWIIGAVLALVAAIGVLGLVLTGSCGCANPNDACVAKPCPDSDLVWFACVFIGAFGAAIALTAGGFTRHNERLREYQSRQGPVTAEIDTGPVAMPDVTGIMTGRRAWSTPPITPVETAEEERLRQLQQRDDVSR